MKGVCLNICWFTQNLTFVTILSIHKILVKLFTIPILKMRWNTSSLNKIRLVMGITVFESLGILEWLFEVFEFRSSWIVQAKHQIILLYLMFEIIESNRIMNMANRYGHLRPLLLCLWLVSFVLHVFYGKFLFILVNDFLSLLISWRRTNWCPHHPEIDQPLHLIVLPQYIILRKWTVQTTKKRSLYSLIIRSNARSSSFLKGIFTVIFSRREDGHGLGNSNWPFHSQRWPILLNWYRTKRTL